MYSKDLPAFTYLLLVGSMSELLLLFGIPIKGIPRTVTGCAPSAISAYLMALFYWEARAFLRKKCGFSALLASAFAALLIAHNQLWDIRFQLSDAVVAFILFYGLSLNEMLKQK